MAGPLDLAAALYDQVAVCILIVHGQLDEHLGELPIVQVCQVAVVAAARHGLDGWVRHSILSIINMHRLHGTASSRRSQTQCRIYNKCVSTSMLSSAAGKVHSIEDALL
jgi:hypothetical protein